MTATNSSPPMRQTISMILAMYSPRLSSKENRLRNSPTCAIMTAHSANSSTRKAKKYLQLRLPTQVPIHGQWWSKRSMHMLHSGQCEALGGRKILQELQNLILRLCDFTGKTYILCWFLMRLFRQACSRGIYFSSSRSYFYNTFGTIPGSVRPITSSMTSTSTFSTAEITTRGRGESLAVTEQQSTIATQMMRCVRRQRFGQEMRNLQKGWKVLKLEISDTWQSLVGCGYLPSLILLFKQQAGRGGRAGETKGERI